MTWDPLLYRRFEDERTRPAQELLARVPLERATRVVDLGCGPGNSTELLLARFPGATLTGIDNSEAMLESARKRLPQCQFEFGEVSTWTALSAPDVIFANAVLHWVPAHEQLFPRLFSALLPGGVLAVQMPDNLHEPSHRSMREVASVGPWASVLSEATRVRAEILTAQTYYDSLAADAARIDVWRTTYHHVLASASEVVDWVRGSGLRPFIDPLSEPERAAFLVEYQARIAEAYPARRDGKLLLTFPRLFIVAQRKQ
ncbi:MAG TPA: trans-aconitate 2-methyltransferase [Polyangiaceae bacterium]|nr:trans-aconitate 2-methyltransferase [Polyangiaceae bacterium]